MKELILGLLMTTTVFAGGLDSLTCEGGINLAQSNYGTGEQAYIQLAKDIKQYGVEKFSIFVRSRGLEALKNNQLDHNIYTRIEGSNGNGNLAVSLPDKSVQQLIETSVYFPFNYRLVYSDKVTKALASYSLFYNQITGKGSVELYLHDHQVFNSLGLDTVRMYKYDVECVHKYAGEVVKHGQI